MASRPVCPTRRSAASGTCVHAVKEDVLLNDGAAPLKGACKEMNTMREQAARGVHSSWGRAGLTTSQATRVHKQRRWQRPYEGTHNRFLSIEALACPNFTFQPAKGQKHVSVWIKGEPMNGLITYAIGICYGIL